MNKWGWLVLALLWSELSVAQQPKDNDFYQQKYQAKWQQMVSELEHRSDLSFVQKMALYEQQVSQLKKQYVAERATDYQGKDETLSVTHTCKGRPAGSTKNCGTVCVERPNKDMFTKPEWVEFTGDYMDEIINEEMACFKLEAKGNTKKVGSVTATFKYRDSYIDYKGVDDADKLFSSFVQ